MKKRVFAIGLIFLSGLMLFTSCGASASHSVSTSLLSQAENKKPPTDVRPNGQYINEDGFLEVPGQDGAVAGDGNLSSFLSVAEYDKFCQETNITLPEQAFDTIDQTMVEVWTIEQTGLKSPKDILVRENDILVVDKDGNCIVVLDKSGRKIKTIGKPGNGTDEFLHPSGITIFNETICVLDGGNDRIQILDEQLNFQNQFQLIRPSEKEDFYNLAYDKDGNLYLSRMDAQSQRMYCYPAGQKGEPIPVAENACGTLAEKDGQVYAINYGSAYAADSPPEDKHTFVQRGFGTGKSYLFSAASNQLTQLSELPTKMGVSAFIANEDGFLLYSDSTARLLQFSADGIFQKAIAEIPLKSPFGHYLAQAEDGTIYMTGAQDSNIYVISQKS